jgi:hypothetical protein
MPRACPSCGRPNADRAARCLYCTEPFEPPSKEETQLEVSTAPRSFVSDRHLIILAPQSDDDVHDDKVRLFAEAVGLLPYDARLALQTKRHRLLRKIEGTSEAKELSERLEELGVDHFDVGEAEVEALSVKKLRWLELGSEHLVQGFLEGESLRTEYSDLALLVRGEIARERRRERQMSTPRGASRRLTSGLRLHLYGRESALAAELDPEQFDWSVLGSEQSASTPINFKLLIDGILGRAAHAELDRGFDWEPVVLTQSKCVTELDSVLGKQTSVEGVVYDNEAQFRYYSRWRCLVDLAERESRKRRIP